MPVVTFGLKNNLEVSDPITPEFLGGKGYSLVKMSQAGIPVPPGLILPVPTYKTYREGGMPAVMKDLKSDINQALSWIADELGYRPLVSVRSGAPVSMPGMMDTVLNVGITPSSLKKLSERYPKWVLLDCFRRFIMMFGDSVRGIPFETFNQIIENAQEYYGKSFKDFNESEMEALCSTMIKIYPIKGKGLFPTEFKHQLLDCIEAVYQSWDGQRAKEYRKIHGIPEDMGTAVVIQTMVFGNASKEDSCSGVLFSRDPNTGKKKVYGDLLYNAQGEDVVSGKYDTVNIQKTKGLPFYSELVDYAHEIEQLYKDMVDIEFTVEKGKLYILQARRGKRSSVAAFQIALDIKNKNPKVSLAKVVRRYVTPDHIKGMSGSFVITTDKHDCQGLAVGGGAFSGEYATRGQSTKGKIFVAKDTTPDDIGLMNDAAAILTTTGGSTSHAAVVARAMDKPCVVGCTDIELQQKKLYFKGYSFGKDATLAIDGYTGRVWLNKDVKTVQGMNEGLAPFASEWVVKVLKGKLRVRASTVLRDRLLELLPDDEQVDVLMEIDTMDDEKLSKALDYVRGRTTGDLHYVFRPNNRPNVSVFMGFGYDYFKKRVMARHGIEPLSGKFANMYPEFQQSLLKAVNS